MRYSTGHLRDWRDGVTFVARYVRLLEASLARRARAVKWAHPCVLRWMSHLVHGVDSCRNDSLNLFTWQQWFIRIIRFARPADAMKSACHASTVRPRLVAVGRSVHRAHSAQGFVHLDLSGTARHLCEKHYDPLLRLRNTYCVQRWLPDHVYWFAHNNPTKPTAETEPHAHGDGWRCGKTDVRLAWYPGALWTGAVPLFGDLFGANAWFSAQCDEGLD